MLQCGLSQSRCKGHFDPNMWLLFHYSSIILNSFSHLLFYNNSVVGGDHLRLGTIECLQWDGCVWYNMGSYTILFNPLLLSLDSVPSLHIHRYSFLFNHVSVWVSLCGASARIWNLIFLILWFVSLQCFVIGLWLSDKCSATLNMIGLVV